MAWRVVPTPTSWFLLIKAAALGGDAGLARALLAGARARGAAPPDARAYAAVVSALLAERRWPDVYAELARMRRAGLAPSAELWVAIFAALRGARRAEDAHYAWRALANTPALVVPPAAYTAIIEALADLGLVDDVAAALVRMRRKRDGAQAPSLAAAAAAFAAYVDADRVEAAAALIE
jgi:hypothetical protein